MSKKKIGILGGTSPQSTLDYYKHIINSYIEQFNDHAYPEIIIYSVNFQKYIDWQKTNDWDKIADDMAEVIRQLEKVGADFALIAANTLHKVFDKVVKKVNIPLLSIVECVAKEAKKLNIKKIGLLGTRLTMTESFYPDRLAKDGIECIVPDEADIRTINEILFNELVKGIIKPESKQKFLEIIEKLEKRGAQGIILGCTEIPLLVSQEDCKIPVLDSAKIHAEYALKMSLDLL